MCGRFTLRAKLQKVAEAFALKSVPEILPRYNIAPTQQVLAIRADQGVRTAALLRWGLVPSWAKDLKIGNATINARAENVATKPAFRSAFKARRCLIVADGFYEWRKGGKTKQPFFIHRRDDEPFAFAGLWERWGLTSSKHVRSSPCPPMNSCNPCTIACQPYCNPPSTTSGWIPRCAILSYSQAGC